MARSYEITTIGGLCPVQAEGMIGGKTEFYFRARGDSWSMSIGPKGSDIIREPAWYHEEPYGVWPEAGYMPEDEVRKFIDQSIHRYWKEAKP